RPLSMCAAAPMPEGFAAKGPEGFAADWFAQRNKTEVELVVFRRAPVRMKMPTRCSHRSERRGASVPSGMGNNRPDFPIASPKQIVTAGQNMTRANQRAAARGNEAREPQVQIANPSPRRRQRVDDWLPGVGRRNDLRLDLPRFPFQEFPFALQRLGITEA